MDGEPDLTEALPWQAEQWAALWARVRAGRLPHALLLVGPEGVGKRHFAHRLARALVCERAGDGGEACGQCRGCRQYAAGSHPDVREIAPPEPGKRIGIDQVRALIAFLGLTTHYGGPRPVILSPAERLTTEAANSLLKTLEEPAPGAVLVLCAARAGGLPATVRSRCQAIAFPPPGEQALAWLAPRLAEAGREAAGALLRLAGGAPLRALALAGSEALAQRDRLLADLQGLRGGSRDPVAAAAEWLKYGVDWSLYWLSTAVADMIRLRSGAGARALVNAELAVALQGLAEPVDLRWLFAYLEQVMEAMRLAQGQVNSQLLLEQTLIDWSGAAADSRKVTNRR